MRTSGWIGYDWFKLIVAIILALLLLVFGMSGAGTAGTPSVTPVPTIAAQLAAPVLKLPAALAAGAVTLAGTGTPGSQVDVLVDGVSVGKATVGADGAWSLPAQLTAGDHKIEANALDAAGNVAASANPATVTVAAALAAPVLKLPESLSAGDVTLSGTGTPGSQVDVLVDGVSVGKATVGADGTWSLPTQLTAGDHKIEANALDAAGNVAASANPATVTVAAALAAPVLKLPESLSAGDVTLSGTGTPGSQVDVLVDGVSVGKATVGADGTWSLPTQLTAGDHKIEVNALDAAGNVVASANPATVKIGEVAAGPTLNPPAASAAGETTLSGTGTPGSQVDVMLDGVSVGKATVGADGTWSLPVTLAAGDHEIVVNELDADGKVVASAAPVKLTVAAGAAQTGQPAITSPADGAQLDTAPLTITGTGVPGSDLEILNSDKVIGTVKVAADGTWSLQITPDPGTASFGIRPVGASDVVGTPIRVTIGTAAQASCTTLEVGCQAWVTREGGKRLRLRDAPSLQGQVLEMLPPGTQMELLEGPQQADNYGWWRVRTVGGKEGWVAGNDLRLQPD